MDVLKNSKFRSEFFYNDCRVSYVENNKCFLLIFRMDENLSEKQDADSIREKCLNFCKIAWN